MLENKEQMLEYFSKGHKILITTEGWFYAPDGNQYKSVWGEVQIFKSEDILGVKPHNYANWFAVVDEQIIIAGCQIHYAILCDVAPARTDVYVYGARR